jgi:hypothetical protein
MNDTTKAIGGALSIVQLLQAGLGLINAAKEAMANGQTSVPKEELRAHLALLDAEIDALEQKIAQ